MQIPKNLHIYTGKDEIVISRGERKGNVVIKKDGGIEVIVHSALNARLAMLHFEGFGSVALPDGWTEEELIECIDYIRQNKEILAWIEME